MPDDDTETPAPVGDWTFAGAGARVYTESRDAGGRNLGLVRPGDIRPFTMPPDQFWRETADGDRELAAAEAGEAEDAAEHEHGREDEPAEGTPQPAPPAAAATA